jgi:hypothetical protein
MYDKICKWACHPQPQSSQPITTPSNSHVQVGLPDPQLLQKHTTGKSDITRGRPADETSDDEINDEEKIDEKMKAKLRIGRYGYHMLP